MDNDHYMTLLLSIMTVYGFSRLTVNGEKSASISVVPKTTYLWVLFIGASCAA